LNSPTAEISDLDNIDWTFEKVDTQEYTHGLHPYPARMVPQIPRTLLTYYKQEDVIEEGGRVYDPFSGSGTTAVEAHLAGMNAEANDINPLACLLTLAKSQPVDIDVLETARDTLVDGLEGRLEEVRQSHTENTLDIEEPEIRDGWFPEPQLYELIAIRERIDRLPDEIKETSEADPDSIQDVVRLLRVSLSSTSRKISYQRNGEYKRYRMSEEDREDHDPDVHSTYISELEDDVESIRKYTQAVDDELTTEIHYADSKTATENGEDAVAENSADIVITSPPYGDHQTTVAYGQFSQDPAIIANDCGYDEMKNVDKTGLGGSYSLEPLEKLTERSESLDRTLTTLREKDGRSEDALKFFTDYYAVMKEVAKILKPGQPVAWVVANRTMSRVTIPTHLITRELCEHIGFEHEQTLPREIPTKTLPWENAPENVEDQKGDLMAEENIVVMRSPE
jgi:DNA modification methylase